MVEITLSVYGPVQREFAYDTMQTLKLLECILSYAMAQPIHWLKYGEFIEGEQKVHAVHIVTHITGPNETREDDVTEGTLTYDGLDAGWEENEEHVHEDGSLLLSALPADEFDRVMSEFEPSKN